MIKKFIAPIPDFEAFLNDDLVSYGCVRALEIMGEAVKHIPDDIRRKYSDIPWKKIAGIRDVLIHDYFGVDQEVIWKTVTINIPQVKARMDQVVRDLES